MMTNPKGFTLVETMVAIAIIMVVITGPFVSIEHAVTASYISRDELIGDSLAQEGIEVVRSSRDSNYLYKRANPASTYNWLAGLDGTANWTGINLNCFANSCTVDPEGGIVSPGAIQIAQCSGTCRPLYVDPTTDIYNQQLVGTPSRFTRSIKLCYINTGGACNSIISNEAKVTATVTWTTGGAANTTTVVDYLQNWL